MNWIQVPTINALIATDQLPEVSRSAPNAKGPIAEITYPQLCINAFKSRADSVVSDLVTTSVSANGNDEPTPSPRQNAHNHGARVGANSTPNNPIKLDYRESLNGG